MKDIPNLLTIFRMLSIPVLVAILYFDGKESTFAATALFLTASLTDFFDGYLARMLSAQSVFGRLFDPIADKLIITATIIMLVYKGKITDINVVASVIIITREIFVSGLREFASNMNISIDVSKFGKTKTVLQIIALTAIILSNEKGILYLLGTSILWIAALVSIISFYQYSKKVFFALN